MAETRVVALGKSVTALVAPRLEPWDGAPGGPASDPGGRGLQAMFLVKIIQVRFRICSVIGATGGPVVTVVWLSEGAGVARATIPR